MKKLSLALLCIVLIYSSGYTADIREYYKHIHRAESYLVSQQFSEACLEYRTAFEQDIALNSDLRNAFKASLLASDSLMQSIFWSKISLRPDVAKSLKKEHIISYPNNYYKDSLLSFSQERLKTWLELQVDSLREVDQQARRSCGNNLKRECIQLYTETDTRNIKYLKSILLKSNFSEEIDGARTLDGIHLIALHARRWGNDELDSLLLEFIKTGRMKAHYLAQLVEIRSDIDTNNHKFKSVKKYGYGHSFMLINDTILRFREEAITLMRIDSSRSEIFMASISLDYKKFQLTRNQPLFKNSNNDLGITSDRLMMSADELQAIIKMFREKNVLRLDSD